MSKFLTKYGDAVLVAASVVLLLTIIAIFVWGISAVTVHLTRAVNPEKGPLVSESQFEIEAAKDILKKRGLVE